MIDLTHNMQTGMPVYPGTEAPEIKVVATIEKEGFEERLLNMLTHTGTHMDAPCHIVKGRKSLSDYDILDFIGEAVLIDVRGMTSIEASVIEQYADKLKTADFVVLYSGWDKYWGDDKYFVGFPVLTAEATQMLVDFGIRGVGMDMISIDPADTETFDNHRIIFNNDILSIENLTNLDQIKSDVFTLHAIPLKIQDGDGSPIRAYGEI